MLNLVRAFFIALLAVTAAYAQPTNSFFYTPGNSTAPGNVQMCFPTGQRAVPCPGTPATGVFSGADTSSATAALGALSSATTYVCSFSVSGLGTSTAGGTGVVVTVGPLIGTVTANYPFFFVNGVTNADKPLNVSFSPCIPASAANQAITVTVPGAAGNTNLNIAVYGYVLGGSAGVASLPQFLLMVDAVNRVLQTDGVSKICLAGTC